MRRANFEHILDMLPHALRITLVGLGEPLLHPEIVDLVAMATEAKRSVSLVTNGMTLERKLARDLCDAGLAGITFSIDAVEPELLRRIRPGSDPERIFENIRGFIEEKNCAQRTRRVVTSAFTALSAHTADALESIADRVADLSIDALMVTDLNFEQNRMHSLRQSLNPAGSEAIRRAIKRAVARRLPVLSVHALEELSLEKRYRRFLLFRAEHLRARSEGRRFCFSPWQTVPVNVDGEISLCDCQPQAKIGNLLETGLGSIWNGERMVEHRREMEGTNPPATCLGCPRF
jgi:radical SAM protein with 4Fe4S-binding SPASM domain